MDLFLNRRTNLFLQLTLCYFVLRCYQVPEMDPLGKRCLGSPGSKYMNGSCRTLTNTLGKYQGDDKIVKKCTIPFIPLSLTIQCVTDIGEGSKWSRVWIPLSLDVRNKPERKINIFTHPRNSSLSLQLSFPAQSTSKPYAITLVFIR